MFRDRRRFGSGSRVQVGCGEVGEAGDKEGEGGWGEHFCPVCGVC